MGPGQIQERADGNDPGGVDVVVGHVVVAPDMIQVHRLGDAWLLVQVPQIAVEVGIIGNPPEVAFEVAVVDGIEPDQGAEEPPIRFDNPMAEQIPPARQPLLQLVQRFEQR